MLQADDIANTIIHILQTPTNMLKRSYHETIESQAN